MRKEDKVIQIGNHVEPKGFSNPQRGRVYSTLGVAPTVNTCGGGDLQPKILQCASRGRSDGGSWGQRLRVFLIFGIADIGPCHQRLGHARSRGSGAVFHL